MPFFVNIGGYDFIESIQQDHGRVPQTFKVPKSAVVDVGKIHINLSENTYDLSGSHRSVPNTVLQLVFQLGDKPEPYQYDIQLFKDRSASELQTVSREELISELFEADVPKKIHISQHRQNYLTIEHDLNLTEFMIRDTGLNGVLNVYGNAKVHELPSYFLRFSGENYESNARLLKLDPADPIDRERIIKAGFDPDHPKQDYELMNGNSSNYKFEKRTFIGTNLSSVVTYYAGAKVGDQATKTVYQNYDANGNALEVASLPHTLREEDLITIQS